MDKQLFDILVTYFERDTMFSSRVEHEHPYLKTIIAWGKAKPDVVIPWLLDILPTNWHWCLALWEIVGEENAPQIPEEFAGQGDYTTQAWLTWGQANGYIL